MAYTTIDKSSLHFNTKLYTGTGSSNAITGVGFQPDLLWIKSRSNTYSHSWTDAVRGKDNKIASNNSNAQYTDAGQLTSFDSDGFTLSTDAGVNNNGSTFVSWNWKANGQGSSNTDGSINTTYTSVNTTAGISISSYSGTGSVGATVGHGLGAVPKMIMVKRLNSSGGDWMVYHESIGNDYRLRLNTIAVKQDNPVWNDTTPTSSVFSLNDNGDANASGGTYVAYCFAEKQGFSKFGSYSGLGTTTGQFVYTGFKPSFVMTKIATTGGSDDGGWVMVDNKRYPNNLSNSPILFANLSNSESDSYNAEFFSNGFRFNANSVTVNGSGNTYSYMAFAETPFVANSGQSIPTTAR